MIKNKSVTVMLKIVGTKCNMSCKYCYEHVSNNLQDYLIPKPDEVIDYLKHFLEFEHIFIVFHGGEPLLANINDIKIILDFISNNFKNNYNIQFQTNGILLNREWIDLFKKYNVSLSVSLDAIGEQDLRHNFSFNYREQVVNNIIKYNRSISNFGIVSVVHKYNVDYYIDFIKYLIKLGIYNLTLNKYIAKYPYIDDPYYITETKYVEMLKEILLFWISSKMYKILNIQPLSSFFSTQNKLCIYSANENKCSYFKTFYNNKNYTEYCDHVFNGVPKTISEKCSQCEIYDYCGSGCLMEIKDIDFCSARKKLVSFIKDIKNIK